jgi:hypothetical protein
MFKISEEKGRDRQALVIKKEGISRGIVESFDKCPMYMCYEIMYLVVSIEKR